MILTQSTCSCCDVQRDLDNVQARHFLLRPTVVNVVDTLSADLTCEQPCRVHADFTFETRK